MILPKIFEEKGPMSKLPGKGVKTELVLKLHEGRPNIEDAIINPEINLVINTPSDKLSKYDDSYKGRFSGLASWYEQETRVLLSSALKQEGRNGHDDPAAVAPCLCTRPFPWYHSCFGKGRLRAPTRLKRPIPYK